MKVLQSLKRDEDGSALIEYIFPLGISLVFAIATMGAVGSWMGTEWTSVSTALGASVRGCTMHAEPNLPCPRSNHPTD